MSATIKDVADLAGVSIATVSHVINKTRYVNPDLTEKVEKAIIESGYITKLESKKIKHYKTGKGAEIAFIVPNMTSVIYSKLAVNITNLLNAKGYMMATYITYGDCLREKHILNEVISNRRIAGIILVPASNKSQDYEKLFKSEIPFVCLERAFSDHSADTVLSDNVDAMYQSTVHLIKCGHENISLLLESGNPTTAEERLKGYKKALKDYNIKFQPEFVFLFDLDSIEKDTSIDTFMKKGLATAYIAGNNTLTLKLLESTEENGIECPNDISIIGFGDNEWCNRISPPLTNLKQDTDKLSEFAAHLILSKINNEKQHKPIHKLVPVELNIRKSTQNIARGPFGEKVFYPEQNVLTEEEIEDLRKGNYKVAISFHYSGDQWTKLHEQAIKETLTRYGIRLLTVSDAHFDPDIQNRQLESLIFQQPDAVIAVPTDEELTTKTFKKISKETKLILINNMPKGFGADDYACWVSVNERENGQNAAKILTNHFKTRNNVKIGMLTHGTPFFATKQRDFFAKQVLNDNLNIDIVAHKDFVSIENTYNICKQMIQEHPEIEGLYITWDRPALKAIEALKEMEREDIVISTTDLDYKIASYLANEQMVIGLSSQRPFEQGTAVAIATAKALLGKNQHKAIGVPPYTVLKNNLPKAWRDLMKTEFPKFS